MTKKIKICCICKKKINDDEPWAGYGPGNDFHTRCIEEMGATAVVAMPEKARQK